MRSIPKKRHGMFWGKAEKTRVGKNLSPLGSVKLGFDHTKHYYVESKLLNILVPGSSMVRRGKYVNLIRLF